MRYLWGLALRREILRKKMGLMPGLESREPEKCGEKPKAD
jgi:hypothetical protein